MANKTMKSVTKWSDLPKDLLNLILEKMPPISLYNSKGVCVPWRAIIKAYTSSKLHITNSKVPWLMMFPEQETDTFSFYSLDEKRACKRLCRPQDFDISLCIGAGHGWLVMLDENVNPYLFNPFTFARIQLASLATYPDVDRIFKKRNKVHIKLSGRTITNLNVLEFESVKDLRMYTIRKAVLSCNPSSGDFFVLMILFFPGWEGQQVAYYHSRQNKWMLIKERTNGFIYMSQAYKDLVCSKDKFTAINRSVEFWDIVDSSPIKRADIVVSIPTNPSPTNPPQVKYQKLYMFELLGDVWLAEKLIGEDQDHPNLLKTLFFRIYKLDQNMSKLEVMESLGDYALLLDGYDCKLISRGHVPEVEANSIYFTDDIWERCAEGTDGEYDVGVFNMGGKTVKQYYQCRQKCERPPCWIDPSSVLVDA